MKAEGIFDKRYKITAKSRTIHSAETIKIFLKSNIILTSMKVGICAFISLRDGRVLLETKSNEELYLLHTNITNHCSQVLEVNIQKLRNSKIVTYNIRKVVTIEYAGEIISIQNSELNLSEGDVKRKFIPNCGRNTRNLVIENRLAHL